MFGNLRKSARTPPPEASLYRALVSRARARIFYEDWGAPDTIDGRFDLIALHAFLVFDALRRHGPAAAELGSKLADAIFIGFDEGLRELGVSDFGMPRRIRNMADAFYGRIESYGSACSSHEMAAAIQRNLYRGHEARGPEAAGLATYMFMARASLGRGISALLEGNPDFGPLPHLVDQ